MHLARRCTRLYDYYYYSVYKTVLSRPYMYNMGAPYLICRPLLRGTLHSDSIELPVVEVVNVLNIQYMQLQTASLSRHAHLLMS